MICCRLAVYLCYSSIGSGQILRPDILTACAVLVYNQILQGDYTKCEKWESVMYTTLWRA
nr:MAG TPA: hypothetical protein [Caudoviricetes sp.]